MGRLGPNKPIVFVPMQAARCIGPESFPIMALHFVNKKASCFTDVFPARLIDFDFI